MFTWSLLDFLWVLAAGCVGGFGWACGNKMFGKLLG
jgi:hypothetical protein